MALIIQEAAVNRPRPFSASLVVLAAVAAAAVGLVSPAAAATPSCGITWGSQPKTAAGMSTEDTTVEGVRAGRHACYDRLVVDLSRYSGGGYTVSYEPVQGDNGVVVPLRGAADLNIVVHAPAYDSTGHPSYAPGNRLEAVPVSGYDTFRQVAWLGSFEGYTQLGLGVRARLPFRVLVVPGTPASDQGASLVIDVAHHW